MRKTHGFVVTLVAILVASGCDRGSLAAPAGAGPAFDHKGWPHGGGNGGGGGDDPASFDLTISGGVLASASGVIPKRDNNKYIMVNFPSGTWNMTATHAAAELERTDPEADDACEFSPTTVEDAKPLLVATLLADRVNGELGVDKNLAKGWIRFREQPDDVWSSWGFNTQTDEPGGALVDDNGSGVDWNDTSSTREFRYSGGFIRVVIQSGPLKGDGSELVCRALDEALITLSPVPPAP